MGTISSNTKAEPEVVFGKMTPDKAYSSVPRKIFILRPDHLGDLILFSGALRHIRNQWPEAHITLCVRSYGMKLFAHCPYIDRLQPYEPLIPLGKINWPLCFPGRWTRALFRVMAPAWSYDLAILPLFAPWVNHHRILQWLPVRERIGIRGNTENQTAEDELRYRGSYSRQMDSSKLSWSSPELETNRLFLEFLGIRIIRDELWPEFWTQPYDRETALNLLGTPQGIFRLGIAPGAVSPPGKRLPAKWYLETLHQAGIEGVQIVLFGGKNDDEICAEIESGLKHSGNEYNVVNLAGKTSVLQLVECIRACDIFLCPDAAPLHIATALRKPVVGMVGGGHFGRFYPWGDPKLSRVINKTMECYGCNWECKYESMRCVQEISPADAARELRSLFQKSAGQITTNSK